MKQLSPLPVQMQGLKAKLLAKATKDPVYKKSADELQKMLEGLNAFVWEFGEACAVGEAVDQATDDTILEAKAREMDAFVSSGEHHLGGAKAAIKRYQGFLA